jgi:predicted transcriptional regulator
MGNIFLASWVTLCQTLAMDLLKSTYELIAANKELSQREIAAGAGVKRDWFAKFVQGKIRSPGTPKVQAVYEFLRAKRVRARDRAA